MLIAHINKEDNDFDDFRKTLRNFFIANISLLIGAGIWVGTIQTQVDRNKQDIGSHTKQVENIEDKINRNDLGQVEIKTKLSGIETMLIEMRTDMKRIK